MSNRSNLLKLFCGLLALCALLSVFTGCIGPGIEDYSRPVGTGYRLVRANSVHIEISPINSSVSADFSAPVIEPLVTKVAWDDRYVLAKQEQSGTENYYILDTYDLELFGPYTLSEFKEKRSELNISEKLALKSPWGGISQKYYHVSEGYTLYESGRGGVNISPDGRAVTVPHIPAKVIEAAWDDRYILAKQEAAFCDIECYHILDTQEKVLYSDLTLSEFETQKKALNIIEELQPVSEILPEGSDSTIFLVNGYELHRKEGDDVYIRPAGDIHNYLLSSWGGDMQAGQIAWDDRYIVSKLSEVDKYGMQYGIIDTLSLEKYIFTESDLFEDKCRELGISAELEYKNAAEYLAENENEYYISGGYVIFRYSSGSSWITLQYPDDAKYLTAHIEYRYPELNSNYETVSEIAWDERWTLAKRLGYKRALPEEYRNGYQIPNEDDPHYYILDTVDHVLYGDYDLDTFNAKCAELGISEKLELKSYKEYPTTFDR